MEVSVMIAMASILFWFLLVYLVGRLHDVGGISGELEALN
jgi:hypothetical protein